MSDHDIKSRSLSFDVSEMDTTLADNYIKERKFCPMGIYAKYLENTGEIVTDKKQVIKIVYSDKVAVSKVTKKDLSPDLKDLSTKLIKLASKITEKSELFSQLEYMIRGRSKNTSSININVIVKNLLYCSSYDSTYKHIKINMSSQETLLSLGEVGQVMMSNGCAVITASEKTAVICYLFTELCYEAGLQSVHLILLNNSTHSESDFNKSCGVNLSCVGIITERSDISSAIDNFLTKNLDYPWCLYQIMVQESVYENFKKILKWKTKSQNNLTLKKFDCKYVDQCYNGKITYLLDYTGSLDECSQFTIPVEAFRTTKELISLMSKRFCVSLWGNDMSQVNEIAFAVDASIVWINDYGSFYGPVKASYSYYQHLLGYDHKVKKSTMESVKVIRNNWLKINTFERRNILYKQIESFLSQPNKFGTGMAAHSILVNKQKNFIELIDDKTCIGIEKSIGVIYIDNLNSFDIAELIESVADGNALLVHDQCDNDLLKWLANDKTIPISIITNPENGEKFEDVRNGSLGLYNLKTIFFNFGTIFAN